MASYKFFDQKSLFKAYDIRGKRHCFTPYFTTALCDALAKFFIINSDCHTVVIGYDTRHGSQQIAENLAKSFNGFGINVIWLGLVTTPIMAYWANQFEGHGLIATASHSEPDYNGIKWLLNGESPSSEDIQQIYHLTISIADNDICSDVTHINNDCDINDDLINDSITNNTAVKNKAIENNTISINKTLLKKTKINSPLLEEKLVYFEPSFVADSYFKATANALTWINAELSRNLLKNNILNNSLSNSSHSNSSNSSSSPLKADPLKAEKPFKIVIDCLNGATSVFAKAFFKQHSTLCSEIIMLNDTPDGDFPKGNPDPMEENRLGELCDAVVFHQADMGFSFDGDGDRLMVVDHHGNPLTPDHLLYILARVAIEDYEGKTSNKDTKSKSETSGTNGIADITGFKTSTGKVDTAQLQDQLSCENLKNSSSTHSYQKNSYSKNSYQKNNYSKSSYSKSSYSKNSLFINDKVKALKSQSVYDNNNADLKSDNIHADNKHTEGASDNTPIVIFDVKCSHHLPVLIRQIGAKGQMSKTGSSIFRRALQAKKYGNVDPVLFAGELSGHYIFNDGYFLMHDDAMYAALRLLNWLYYQPINAQTKTRTTIADIVASLPPLVSTTDVYLPVDNYTLKEFNCLDTDIGQGIKEDVIDLKNLAQEPLKFHPAQSNTQRYKFNNKMTHANDVANNLKKGVDNAESVDNDINIDSIRQTILNQMASLCQSLLNSSMDPDKCCANFTPADSNFDSNSDSTSDSLLTSAPKATLETEAESKTGTATITESKTERQQAFKQKSKNEAKTETLTNDFRLSFIDGLRLDFEHGFGIIRSSRTSNKLTVRFAGDTQSDLQQIQRFFVNICQSVNQDLAKQVANISINR